MSFFKILQDQNGKILKDTNGRVLIMVNNAVVRVREETLLFFKSATVEGKVLIPSMGSVDGDTLVINNTKEVL